MKRFLFICHEASRTGAPLVLLHFIKWLKANHKEIDIHLLVLGGGSLLEEFKSVADEFYYKDIFHQKKSNFFSHTIKKILFKTGLLKKTLPVEELVRDLGAKDFDLIYANTVVSLPVAHDIKIKGKCRSRLVAHVHELEGEIKRTVKSLENYRSEIDMFIAASRLIQENLLRTENIPLNKIKIIYPFTKYLKQREFGTNKAKFIVGGSGKFGLRKGSDVFIQTARYVKANFPEEVISFIWVGLISERDKRKFKTHFQKLDGVSIEFTGEVENPEEHFQTFDLFYLSSREDPFPLVCIEAGMIGMPIICFNNSTGISELIENNGGFVAPYLNIDSVAKTIVNYKRNPQLQKEHTLYNQSTFIKFTVDEKAPEIFNVLEELIEPNGESVIH